MHFRSQVALAAAALAASLIARPAAAVLSANGMLRVGALTLSNNAYGGLYSAIVDPANGYAYFGGKHGWVVKLDIKGGLPVERGAVQCPSGQPNTALIDVATGHGYFLTSSKVDRVLLGAGDDPPTYVDTLQLPGSSLAGVIDTSDSDPANHYAYFECTGTPDQIVKVSLATFTIVGSGPLAAGETAFRRGVIDTGHGYAYFVGPAAEAAPPVVVKIALSAGSAAPSRVGAVQLDSIAHGMGSAVIDTTHGYAYFGTYYGANSVPATIFKVALGAGSSPPSLVDHVTLSAGTGAENGPNAAERELCTAVFDAGSGYAYLGTDHTYPAKVFQVSVGNGGSAPVETGVLALNGGTQPVGEPSGPNDGENVINNPSSLYGEVFLQSSVVDPVRGYAYFGTDGYPGMIVKVLLPPAAPSIGNGPPPDGTVGVLYSFTYAGAGTPAPTFSVIAGNLPPGLELGATGVISGTPTTIGSYAGTVQAENGTGPAATQPFDITITESTAICGDGVVQAGEQCDEGAANGAAGSCCSATCRSVAAGASCDDDGNPCTSDLCDGAGACTHVVPRDAGCRTADRATLRLKAGRLAWKWMGSDVTPDDLGNPLHATGYGLCVLDTAAGALAPALDATIAAGGTCAGRPCWSARAGGYAYHARGRTADGLGLSALQLRAGPRSEIRILAKGSGITTPMGAPVVVRLEREDAPMCWEATFSSLRRHEAGGFHGRSD